jgi:hypothetical protein
MRKHISFHNTTNTRKNKMAAKKQVDTKVTEITGGALVQFKSDTLNVMIPSSSILGQVRQVEFRATKTVVRDYQPDIKINRSLTLIPKTIYMLNEVAASVLATANPDLVEQDENDKKPHLVEDKDQTGLFYYMEYLNESAVELTGAVDITVEPSFVSLAGKSEKNHDALHTKLYRFTKLVQDMNSLHVPTSLEDDSLTSAPTNLIQADHERDSILQRSAERARLEFKATMDETYDYLEEKIYSKQKHGVVQATPAAISNLMAGHDEEIIKGVLKDLMQAY